MCHAFSFTSCVPNPHPICCHETNYQPYGCLNCDNNTKLLYKKKLCSDGDFNAVALWKTKNPEGLVSAVKTSLFWCKNAKYIRLGVTLHRAAMPAGGQQASNCAVDPSWFPASLWGRPKYHGV
jgi:hypothetical protein